MTFGAFVRNERKTRGLKQYEFAELLGIEQSKLNKYETGYHVPQFPEALKMLRDMGVSLPALESISTEEPSRMSRPQKPKALLRREEPIEPSFI